MPKFLQRTIRLKTLLLTGLSVLVVLLMGGYWLRDKWFPQFRAWGIGSIELASEKYIWLLPEVDRVVIYAIEEDSKVKSAEHKDLPRWGDSTYVILKEVALEGEKAKGLVDNWRNLETHWAIGSMCYKPAHALRFYHKRQLVLEAEFCWKCATLKLPIVLGKAPTGFKRETESAKTLWKLMQEYVPLEASAGTNATSVPQNL